jgi:hypothetical protein
MQSEKTKSFISWICRDANSQEIDQDEETPYGQACRSMSKLSFWELSAEEELGLQERNIYLPSSRKHY